jgi:hypothetical protein
MPGVSMWYTYVCMLHVSILCEKTASTNSPAATNIRSVAK